MAEDGGKKQSDVVLVVLALAVLVNSAALFYGFQQIRGVSRNVRWALLAVAPEAARAVAAGPTQENVRTPSLLEVELYSDFDCRFCRGSVHAVDSVRALFGDSVSWTYRYFANPRSDLSLSSALAAYCAGRVVGPWAVYSQIDSEESWSGEVFERELQDLGVPVASLTECVRSDEAVAKVWQDIFRGFATGRRGTPTLVVDGIELVGRIEVDPLVSLIRNRIDNRTLQEVPR